MEKNMSKSNYRYRDAKTGYLMISLALLCIALFQIVPLIMAIVRAFQDYQTRGFVGLRNFRFVLRQEVFLQSFTNVLIFLAFILVISILCSFLLAMVLKNMDNLMGSATKIIIYLPALFSGILISVIFLFIFNYGGGLVTSILLTAGVDPIPLTSFMPWPYVLIIGISIWGSFGYHSLVMYAGVIGISKDYYEAAMIDGANAFERLWHITIPCMKNYFILTIINITTGTLMMFELPFMITGGGPLNKTYTPILYIYNTFNDFTMDSNIVIAGAILVAILIGIINAFVFKIIRSEISMEG